jgi:predicted dehydrogenase
MTTRFMFVGFRHPHIEAMYRHCREREDVEIVACCEEDAATRQALADQGEVQITHHHFEQALNTVNCDVVAVGDCFGRRGRLLCAALEAGKHVISDKPICTSLAELDRIEALAHTNGLIVGCMLDMRDLAPFLGLRQYVQAGEIGTVRSISFDGQHPLLFGRRAGWYFEPGMHGGTLNDIAVHAVDMIPWATGLRVQSIVSARSWNARLPQYSHFQECGQAMLELENGAGVLCDVSYLSPDSFGYAMPLYWRFTIWGDDGVLITGVNQSTLTLYRNGERQSRELPLPVARTGAYLDAFLREIRGQRQGLHLSSAEVLRAARTSLLIQEAADQRLAHVFVPS